MENELILLSDFLENTGADADFVFLLEQEGLIDTEIRNQTKYLLHSQINDLQRFIHLHDDLSINVEGIDVINNLLCRMREMDEEIAELRRKIRLFDDFSI